MLEIVVADLASSAQAEAVVYLLNEYAMDEMGGGAELSDFAKANLIPELRKRENVFAVLAFMDHNPVGLALCIEGFSSFYCKPTVNIHDLVVVAEQRGKGVSLRLLEKVEETAKARGCCKLTLEVLEGNHPAQKAYLSFGFGGYELDPKFGKALFWQKALM